jgi:hypothetical protein
MVEGPGTPAPSPLTRTTFLDLRDALARSHPVQPGDERE